jgi:replicative DNA helicase
MSRRAPVAMAPAVENLPPEEIARERGLIGGILEHAPDPVALSTLRAFEPEWCYSPTTRELCERLQRLDARGVMPDALGLEADLRTTGDLDRLGGAQALTGLLIEAAVPATMPNHLAAVRTAWAKRTAATDAEAVRLHAMNGSDPAALAGEFRAAAERLEGGTWRRRWGRRSPGSAMT